MFQLQRAARGFTLVELLTVVSIIAILALIAYPSYVDQVRRARRSQAQSDMLESAHALERFHTERLSYVGFGPAPNTMPAGQTASPRTGQAWYAMDFSADRTADAFTIRATPQGDQTNDRCGVLTLDQAGVRTAAGGTVEDCWSGGR